MPNIKTLSLRIKKLWPMLKFFKNRSKVTVKVTQFNIYRTVRKVLSSGTHMPNMKDLSHRAHKL